MSAVNAPSTLSKAGRTLWKTVTGKYELRPDELTVLEDACAATDMIAALEAAWSEDGKPMTTKGSMGQQVIHPLIGEIRAQRAFRDAALARLKLPDDAEEPAESNQHRDAAQSRWSARTRGA